MLLAKAVAAHYRCCLLVSGGLVAVLVVASNSISISHDRLAKLLLILGLQRHNKMGTHTITTIYGSICFTLIFRADIPFVRLYVGWCVPKAENNVS